MRFETNGKPAVSSLQRDDKDINKTTDNRISMTRPKLSTTRKEYVYDHNEKHQVPRNVTHVIVQAHCRSIEWRAFDSCIHLREVSFEGVQGLQIIHSLTFWGCTSLRTIHLPSCVIRIGNCAFEECISLREVGLPERLEHIAESAFYDCTSLECIDIPRMTRKIDKYAFAKCQSLREIRFAPSFSSESGRLEVIGSCAFMKCVSLRKARIPNTVISIGQSAFEGCSSLQQVIMGADEQEPTSCMNTRKVASMNIHLRAFQDCVQLTHVRL